jgi:hypothetical protein
MWQTKFLTPTNKATDNLTLSVCIINVTFKSGLLLRFRESVASCRCPETGYNYYRYVLFLSPSATQITRLPLPSLSLPIYYTDHPIVSSCFTDWALWSVLISNYFWNYESVPTFGAQPGRGINPLQGLYLQRKDKHPRLKKSLYAV